MSQSHKPFLMRGRGREYSAHSSTVQQCGSNHDEYSLARLAREQEKYERKRREAWEKRSWFARLLDRWMWMSTS